MICRAECLALYGKEQILQGYSNIEGQELSGLSTSEHSQVHWDDELMQSRSSMSSASDPFPILTHTFITLLISFPLCLILLTHSYLFRLPSFFSPHKPFSFTLLSSSFCISRVSPTFALYCSCQEMRQALNYCAHGIINVKVVVCSAGQQATG